MSEKRRLALFDEIKERRWPGAWGAQSRMKSTS
jgi:hypothetical protein